MYRTNSSPANRVSFDRSACRRPYRRIQIDRVYVHTYPVWGGGGVEDTYISICAALRARKKTSGSRQLGAAAGPESAGSPCAGHVPRVREGRRLSPAGHHSGAAGASPVPIRSQEAERGNTGPLLLRGPPPPPPDVRFASAWTASHPVRQLQQHLEAASCLFFSSFFFLPPPLSFLFFSFPFCSRSQIRMGRRPTDGRPHEPFPRSPQPATAWADRTERGFSRIDASNPRDGGRVGRLCDLRRAEHGIDGPAASAIVCSTVRRLPRRRQSRRTLGRHAISLGAT